MSQPGFRRPFPEKVWLGINQVSTEAAPVKVVGFATSEEAATWSAAFEPPAPVIGPISLPSTMRHRPVVGTLIPASWMLTELLEVEEPTVPSDVDGHGGYSRPQKGDPLALDDDMPRYSDAPDF